MMVKLKDIDRIRETMAKAGLWDTVGPMLDASGFTLQEFLDDIRTPPRLVRLRHEIWYLAYEERDYLNRRVYSLPELGHLFNRDHTTILAGVRKHHAATTQSNGTNGGTALP